MGYVNIRVTGRGDEVEQSVNSVVPEARVTLDTGLLRENVIVLALQVANNLLEAARKNVPQYVARH